MLPDLNFSVVVATFERVALIEALLISLTAAREAYAGAVEVILVDSSPLEMATQIRHLCLAHNATFLTGEQSVRAKLNRGIRAACHPIIFFTDSDCTVMPGVFEAHSQDYEECFIPNRVYIPNYRGVGIFGIYDVYPNVKRAAQMPTVHKSICAIRSSALSSNVWQ